MRVTSTYSITTAIWQELTSATDVEQNLLTHKKRHLQQMLIEGGRCNEEPMTTLHRDHGINSNVTKLLAGELVLKQEVSEEMAAWMQAMKQTPAERESPPIVGCIPKRAYQEMFKMATKSTSSNSTWGLHLLFGKH